MVDERIPELRERLGLLARHKALIAAVTLIAGGGAVAYSIRQTPVYEGTSRVVVRPALAQAALPSFPSGSSVGPLGLDLSIDTEAQIARSELISKRVVNSLGLPVRAAALASTIEAEAVTENVIEIKATAGTAMKAAELANAVASEYLANRRETALGAAAAIANDLRARVAKLERRVDALDAQILRSSQRLEDRGPRGAAALRADIRRLRAERDQLIVQFSVLRAQYQDLTVNRAATVSGGEIVERAVPAATQASPQPLRDGLVGLFLGAVVGVGLAFLREHLDRRIRTRDEAARAARAPVVASLPRGSTTPKRRSRGRGSSLVALSDPGSGAARTYRTLAANLMAVGLGRGVRSLVMTSMRDDRIGPEAVANLGALCARAGLHVMAVSADVRNPRVRQLLHYELRWFAGAAGLVSVLRGQASVAAAAMRTDIPNLAVLPAGAPAEDATDLLNSANLDRALEAAGELADVLVIEAPPMSSEAEAVRLATLADAVLIVVRAGTDTKDAVGMASVILERAHAPIDGVFLVDADPHDQSAGTPTPLTEWLPTAFAGDGNGRPTEERGAAAVHTDPGSADH